MRYSAETVAPAGEIIRLARKSFGHIEEEKRRWQSSLLELVSPMRLALC